MSKTKPPLNYQAKRKQAAQQKQRLIGQLLMAAGGLLLLGVIALGLWPLLKPANVKPEVTGAPALRADKEKIDLGDVRLGNTVSASFQLTNVGDKPLNFTKAPYIEVAAGCWPPTPTIGAMVLQPGASTTVSMEFLMHGDMGGKHDFRLHLDTNDPAQPDRTVTVLSNWVP